MTCCGQRRQQMRSEAMPARQAEIPAKAVGIPQPPVQQQGATFHYVGKTAMTAIGPRTTPELNKALW
jgi:hypothetical protein